MSAHVKLGYVTFKLIKGSSDEQNEHDGSQLELITNIFNVLILFQMCLFGLCGALLQAERP